jgi:hypothetical protein
MMRLTWPSTAPELQGRLSPLVTASWSARSPVTKERSAGSLVARAAVIHGSRSFLPRRSFMMTSNARTLAATAASWGELARMASRLAWSAVSIWPGSVMIQLVTALTFGGTGAGAGAAAFPRKRAR